MNCYGICYVHVRVYVYVYVLLFTSIFSSCVVTITNTGLMSFFSRVMYMYYSAKSWNVVSLANKRDCIVLYVYSCLAGSACHNIPPIVNLLSTQ